MQEHGAFFVREKSGSSLKEMAIMLFQNVFRIIHNFDGKPWLLGAIIFSILLRRLGITATKTLDQPALRLLFNLFFFSLWCPLLTVFYTIVGICRVHEWKSSLIFRDHRIYSIIMNLCLYNIFLCEILHFLRNVMKVPLIMMFTVMVSSAFLFVETTIWLKGELENDNPFWRYSIPIITITIILAFLTEKAYGEKANFIPFVLTVSALALLSLQIFDVEIREELVQPNVPVSKSIWPTAMFIFMAVAALEPEKFFDCYGIKKMIETK